MLAGGEGDVWGTLAPPKFNPNWAELRLVDGGELGRRHDPRMNSIRHVDDGPYDHRGSWRYCETQCGSDPKGGNRNGKL